MIFFFFFMGVDQLSTQMKMEMALFLAVPLVLGLHSDIIYFGALRIGRTQSRQVNGSPACRSFLETKWVMVEHCSKLPYSSYASH